MIHASGRSRPARKSSTITGVPRRGRETSQAAAQTIRAMNGMSR